MISGQKKQSSITLDGASSVKAGSTFAVKLGVSNVTSDVYASDITLNYNAELFELQQVDSATNGIEVVKYVDNGKGNVRILLANIGSEQLSQQIPLVNVVFKAKGSANSSGEISVVTAVMADGEGSETEAAPAKLVVKIESSSSNEDLNHDGKISIGDLAKVANHYGKDSSSPDWNVAIVADLDGNGTIDIEDLAKMAQKLINL